MKQTTPAAMPPCFEKMCGYTSMVCLVTARLMLSPSCLRIKLWHSSVALISPPIGMLEADGSNNTSPDWISRLGEVNGSSDCYPKKVMANGGSTMFYINILNQPPHQGTNSSIPDLTVELE
ncbi:MAG: hypothetical protein HC862_19600 [Scytonema sp. RU_4_4]|nr:hypothetical protein [Scytonema sp. RU_4_4]